MTLTQLACKYCPEGRRGGPVSARHSRRLFQEELLYGNGKFKPIRTILQRMGWRKERPLTQLQLQFISSRLC